MTIPAALRNFTFKVDFNAFDTMEAPSLFTDLSIEEERKLSDECKDVYKLEQTLWHTVKSLADYATKDSRAMLRTFFGLSESFIDLLALKSAREVYKLCDRYLLSFALNDTLQHQILNFKTQLENIPHSTTPTEQLRGTAFWRSLCNVVRSSAAAVRPLRSGLQPDLCDFLSNLSAADELKLYGIELRLCSLKLRYSEDLAADILCAANISRERIGAKYDLNNAVSPTTLAVLDHETRMLRTHYRDLKFLQIVSNLDLKRKQELKNLDYDAMLRQISPRDIEKILNEI